MLQEKTWAPIVRAALDDYLRKKSAASPIAVPAAPLKPLIARYAEQSGLVFPPAGYERFKFVDFLALFPSVIKIQRRPGQDALVVTAERADLFADFAQDDARPVNATRARVLRSDVFQAFTKIQPRGQHYWYSKVSDEFLATDVNRRGQSLVPVPVNTIEDALAERGDFVSTIADADQQRELRGVLSEPSSSLGAFSQLIKELHLEQSWHVFRFDRLVQRIKDWTVSERLEWNDDWTGRGRLTEQEQDTVTARETNAFLAGLMRLGPEDAKRVMVPLDIVLKLMRRD